MTIPLLSTGGLFTRWGKMLGGSNEAQGLINATLTSRVASINAQFASTDENVLQDPSSNLALMQNSLQNAQQAWFSGLQNMQVNTLLQMALDDGIQRNPLTLRDSLVYLIAQMNLGGYANTASIQRPTITINSANPTAQVLGSAGINVLTNATNTGNGVLTASCLDFDGHPLDYMIAETVNATCSADGYAGGGATAGSEPFTSLGMIPAASVFGWNYGNSGVGSGSNSQLTTLNPALTSGLIITDGNFENWSVNVPTSWATVTGAATITKGNTPYLGSFNLRITGDGATLTRIKQAVTLLPNTVYACNFYAHSDGSVAAGVLRVSLINYDTETIINDGAANANTISTNASALTSSYAPYSGYFRTPNVLPTNCGIMLYLSTAVTNTEVIDIDALGLQAATQLYNGGPFMAIFCGSTNFATGDNFAVPVANNNSTTTFSLQLPRFLGLPALGLKFPSANSPTITDALIS